MVWAADQRSWSAAARSVGGFDFLSQRHDHDAVPRGCIVHAEAAAGAFSLERRRCLYNKELPTKLLRAHYLLFGPGAAFAAASSKCPQRHWRVQLDETKGIYRTRAPPTPRPKDIVHA
jgi:hypothetical protein